MNICRPADYRECLKRIQEGARPAAGCTNLLVNLKKNGIADARYPQADYVDLTPLAELSGIRIEEEALQIGAMTTFAQVESALEEDGAWRALYEAAYLMGGPQIRNRASLAGNLCDASPAADAAPPLLVLNAALVADSLGEDGRIVSRTIPMEQFFVDFRQTALRPGELIRRIEIPRQEGASFFRKIGLRSAMAISVVTLAGKRFADGTVRLAAGSVAPTPVRLLHCEQLLSRKETFEKNTLRQALEQDIRPITDLRAGAQYRRTAAFNLLAASLRDELGYREEA